MVITSVGKKMHMTKDIITVNEVLNMMALIVVFVKDYAFLKVNVRKRMGTITTLLMVLRVFFENPEEISS